jgi:hypothetical protein
VIASRVRSFARFWWDFVVGDDWRVSVQVALAVAATAALAASGVVAWWLLPVAVVAVLFASLRRATRGEARR